MIHDREDASLIFPIARFSLPDLILHARHIRARFELLCAWFLSLQYTFQDLKKKKKPSENFLFNSVLNFSIAIILLVVTIFTWLQNKLISRSQRLNKAIPSILNKFIVFFNTITTGVFFCFSPQKKCYRWIRLKNLLFFMTHYEQLFLKSID